MLSEMDLRVLLNSNRKSGFLVRDMISDSRPEVLFRLFVYQATTEGRFSVQTVGGLSFRPIWDDTLSLIWYGTERVARFNDAESMADVVSCSC